MRAPSKSTSKHCKRTSSTGPEHRQFVPRELQAAPLKGVLNDCEQDAFRVYGDKRRLPRTISKDCEW
jgi:hypothetical protein